MVRCSLMACLSLFTGGRSLASGGGGGGRGVITSRGCLTAFRPLLAGTWVGEVIAGRGSLTDGSSRSTGGWDRDAGGKVRDVGGWDRNLGGKVRDVGG